MLVNIEHVNGRTRIAVFPREFAEKARTRCAMRVFSRNQVGRIATRSPLTRAFPVYPLAMRIQIFLWATLIANAALAQPASQNGKVEP
jgi:hypothetical protein